MAINLEAHSFESTKVYSVLTSRLPINAEVAQSSLVLADTTAFDYIYSGLHQKSLSFSKIGPNLDIESAINQSSRTFSSFYETEILESFSYQTSTSITNIDVLDTYFSASFYQTSKISSSVNLGIPFNSDLYQQTTSLSDADIFISLDGLPLQNSISNFGITVNDLLIGSLSQVSYALGFFDEGQFPDSDLSQIQYTRGRLTFRGQEEYCSGLISQKQGIASALLETPNYDRMQSDINQISYQLSVLSNPPSDHIVSDVYQNSLTYSDVIEAVYDYLSGSIYQNSLILSDIDEATGVTAVAYQNSFINSILSKNKEYIESNAYQSSYTLGIADIKFPIIQTIITGSTDDRSPSMATEEEDVWSEYPELLWWSERIEIAESIFVEQIASATHNLLDGPDDVWAEQTEIDWLVEKASVEPVEWLTLTGYVTQAEMPASGANKTYIFADTQHYANPVGVAQQNTYVSALLIDRRNRLYSDLVQETRVQGQIGVEPLASVLDVQYTFCVSSLSPNSYVYSDINQITVPSAFLQNNIIFLVSNPYQTTLTLSDIESFDNLVSDLNQKSFISANIILNPEVIECSMFQNTVTLSNMAASDDDYIGTAYQNTRCFAILGPTADITSALVQKTSSFSDVLFEGSILSSIIQNTNITAILGLVPTYEQIESSSNQNTYCVVELTVDDKDVIRAHIGQKTLTNANIKAPDYAYIGSIVNQKTFITLDKLFTFQIINVNINQVSFANGSIKATPYLTGVARQKSHGLGQIGVNSFRLPEKPDIEVWQGFTHSIQVYEKSSFYDIEILNDNDDRSIELYDGCHDANIIIDDYFKEIGDYKIEVLEDGHKLSIEVVESNEDLEIKVETDEIKTTIYDEQ